MVRKFSGESQRSTIYLLAGAAAGFAIMVLPALFFITVPQARVFCGMTQEGLFDGRGPWAAYGAASPIEVFLEVLWLVLPALIVILALYWLAVHRTRWAGHDEAAKWSRR